MTDTVSTPALPVITITEDAQLGARRITTTYSVDDGTNRIVEVTTYHHGDRTKAFVTSALPAVQTQDGPFTSTAYSVSIMDTARIALVPAARYSAKGLQAAHAAAIENLVNNAQAATWLLELADAPAA